MSRITPRKDALASFIWTAGAADMVIGGVGERGSLFTLGLLTVCAGLLVRWLRQQRHSLSHEMLSAPRTAAYRSAVNQVAALGRDLAKAARRSSVSAAAQLKTASARQPRYRGRRPSRSPVAQSHFAQSPLTPPRRGYSAAVRPGLQANRFVRQSAELINPPSSPPVRPPAKSPSQASSQTPLARPSRQPVSPQSVQDSPPGPPLNLPPAPQPRTRRERRVY